MDNQQSTTPWWYHVGLGLLASATTVVMLLAPGFGSGLAVFLMVVLGIVFDRATRRLRPKPRLGPARPGYILIGVVAVILLVSILLGTWFLVATQGLTWVAWIAGLAVLVLGIGGGFLSERFR